MQMITSVIFVYILTPIFSQTVCNSSEWTCTTGQCIDVGHRCDGTEQCTDTSDETNCYCVDQQINLLIAVQEEKSEYINPFIKDFLKDVALGGRNVMVRFVMYKDSTVLMFNNNEMSSKEIKTRGVDELKWNSSTNAEFRSIVAFLSPFSPTLYFGAHRQSARNILFLIIVKLNFINFQHFEFLSKTIKDKGIRIMALEITGVNHKLLDSIVSEPIENNKYTGDSFQNLSWIIPKLTSDLCPKEKLKEHFLSTSQTITSRTDETTGLKEKLAEIFSTPALISTAIDDETTRSKFSPPAKTSTTINDTNTGYCYSSEWTCTTGQCIDIGHRCDGTDQCTDKSDETNCYCDDKPINLLIAIDEGATEDINIIINKFIKDFLKDLAVDGKNVIVWFLKYKDTVILSFNRTEVSKVKTLKAIDELKWESSPDAEFSDIVSFVNSKSQLFFGAHRQRARHILLLITLYLTKHNYKNFAAVTKIIKEKGMYIIAVGVNLENSVYLHFVASDPIEKNTFAVDASKDLNKIIPRLTSTLCEGSSLNGLKELTDKSAPTILISTTMPDDRISTLVSAASGSASNTAIIVSLVVLAILFISIAAYKFKEKLWCFSRNASRTPTISNNTIDQEYLDVDHYDYMSHYEVETGGRIKPQDKNTGNTKPVPQEDHYDNVDYTIENVSGYITPIDVVYNSTADRELSRIEEHRSTGDRTQIPEL